VHKPSTVIFHSHLSWASLLILFHVCPISFISCSTVLCHVPFGLPLSLFPSVVLLNTIFAGLLSSILNECLSHLHCLVISLVEFTVVIYLVEFTVVISLVEFTTIKMTINAQYQNQLYRTGDKLGSTLTFHQCDLAGFLPCCRGWEGQVTSWTMWVFSWYSGFLPNKLLPSNIIQLSRQDVY